MILKKHGEVEIVLSSAYRVWVEGLVLFHAIMGNGAIFYCLYWRLFSKDIN